MPLDRWSQKPGNGQLTVTIGKFYRVTGESTQHRGVEPDVPLASLLDTKEVGESALESALPWDRIAGVPFKTSAGTAAAPPVTALATEEDARAQHDPDYRWLMSDIAAIDSVREQHSVSLNLKARREERARIDHERLERENNRRAAKNLPPLKSVEELEKTKDDAPDVVLDQATQIMADMVTGARPQPAKTAAPTTRACSRPSGLSAAARGTGPRCPRRARSAAARRRRASGSPARTSPSENGQRVDDRRAVVARRGSARRASGARCAP